MNEIGFSLSIKAQNIEHHFYNKLAIVYVEGKDDLVFWNNYFSDKEFELRESGGCKELEKKMQEIIQDKLRVIVACDSDYSHYIQTIYNHPLIIRTISHSIECMMYCPININKCIKNISRSLEDKIETIESLYHEFCLLTKELLVYDITSNKYKKGISIFDDSCKRFLTSNNSVRISQEKIDQFITGIKSQFNDDDLNEIRQQIEKDKRPLRNIIKGHFQTDFVRNVIKYLSESDDKKGVSISNDALFALLIECTPKCTNHCEEKNYLVQKIEDAKSYLKCK